MLAGKIQIFNYKNISASMKHLIILVALALFGLPLSSRAQSGGHFASQLLLGAGFGAEYDYVSEWDNQYEMALFFSQRAGISLNKRWYAGIQTRIIRARNFETDMQSFYMAGIWGRYYFIQPFMRERPGRWALFAETGLLTGNYSYDNVDFIEYYVQRPGQWYIPAVLGGEFRVWRNLSLEFGVHLYYTVGKSWDQYGIAYPHLGLNWRGNVKGKM